MSYFPPYSNSKITVEVELDLSNYATKSDLKHTSQFAKKDDLANLKSEVDKLDIDKLSELHADKLKSIPTDLNKLSDAVKNDIVKKKDYNKDKISSITNLDTTVALTTVENKILNVSDLMQR